MGTVDAWLVWRLTGELAIEAGNASRTLLLDLQTLEWDPELLDLFGVPVGVLPEVRASDAGFGRTVGTGGVPAGIPVVAVLADSHAALYYHGCTAPGTGKVTYGTGSSVMTPVEPSGPRTGRDRHDPGLAGGRDADVRAGGQHPGERLGSGLDGRDVGLVRRGPRR